MSGVQLLIASPKFRLRIGLEKRDRVEQVAITWPSGRTEDFKKPDRSRCYECIEGKGIHPQTDFNPGTELSGSRAEGRGGTSRKAILIGVISDTLVCASRCDQCPARI